jgi:cell shape-determining protein MreD
MLYLTLIVYFLARNSFITENNHEWGKYLVILDNVFLDYIQADKYFYLYTKDKSRN